MSEYVRMPGEWEPHRGTIIIWPFRPGSWPKGATEAADAFLEVIRGITKSEEAFVVVNDSCKETARRMLEGLEGVTLVEASTDDSWARDIGPTFVKTEDGTVKGINWSFNAWGGEVDGLYASWDKDDAFAEQFLHRFGYEMIDAAPFVLEGGSIHSDGEGTLLVTESCLLSKGRNPSMTKEQIEATLKHFLGVQKVLWLPRGIYNDETNEHVDNVCAFVKPGEVVLAWTEEESDPQYELSKACLEYLQQERDAKGRKIVVHKLPIPDYPILVQKEDLEGYVFEEGEDVREVGERMAASYVNFYFTNGAVLVPCFGGENTQSDKRAMEILAALCPHREVIGIPARAILAGGGNIHCITQQVIQ